MKIGIFTMRFSDVLMNIVIFYILSIVSLISVLKSAISKIFYKTSDIGVFYMIFFVSTETILKKLWKRDFFFEFYVNGSLPLLMIIIFYKVKIA